MHSKFFPGISKREVGLKLSGFVGGLSGFGISFTDAFFQEEGKYPADSEALNILVRLVMAMFAKLFRIVLLKPLLPGQVFFMCVKISFVSVVVLFCVCCLPCIVLLYVWLRYCFLLPRIFVASTLYGCFLIRGRCSVWCCFCQECSEVWEWCCLRGFSISSRSREGVCIVSRGVL